MNPNQLAIFTEPGVRHDDPQSSVAAAESVRPSHQARLQAIADIVDDAAYWGATADEVHARLALDGVKRARSTTHSAVSAAQKAGLILPRPDGAKRLSVFNQVMTVFVTARHTQRPVVS